MPLDHHLGDPVGNRWNPERPGSSSIALRYVNATHGWGKVASRRHSVPDPIEVLTQIPVEILDRTARPLQPPLGWPSLACTLPTPRVWAIQNGLASTMVVIPFQVATGIKLNDDAPSVRSHCRTFQPYYGRLRPCAPHRYSDPHGDWTAWVSPSHPTGRQVPVFLTEACPEVTPPSCRTTPVGAVTRYRPTLARPGQKSGPRFRRRRLNTLRHVIERFTRVRLLRTHLTE